jgi:hypothetical protein
MGARVLSPWALKDHPCPSFYLGDICCSGWKEPDIFSTLVNFWVATLSLVCHLLHVIIKIHVHVNTVSSLLLRFVPWLSSSVMLYWFFHVRACNMLSLSHVWSPNGGKSSRVSHTSCRMVWTCCWCSPSTSLRPPPQLTSDWISELLELWQLRLEVYICTVSVECLNVSISEIYKFVRQGNMENSNAVWV